METEISRMDLPYACKLSLVKDPPSKKATIVSAMIDNSSYQASTSGGIRSNPAPPATIPQPNNKVTRGKRVR